MYNNSIPEQLAAIKAHVALPQIIKRYSDLEIDGSDNILCPFHDEDTPSCHLWNLGSRFHCFGCGKNGDIFDMAARLLTINGENTSYTAAKIIDNDFNLGVIEEYTNGLTAQRIANAKKQEDERIKKALEKKHAKELDAWRLEMVGRLDNAITNLNRRKDKTPGAKRWLTEVTLWLNAILSNDTDLIEELHRKEDYIYNALDRISYACLHL